MKLVVRFAAMSILAKFLAAIALVLVVEIISRMFAGQWSIALTQGLFFVAAVLLPVIEMWMPVDAGEDDAMEGVAADDGGAADAAVGKHGRHAR